MGRRPVPIPILKLHGSSTLRKKQNRGKEAPKPPEGRPVEPPLPQYAADLHRSIMSELEQTPGLLTKVDGPQIERYARFYVRWRLVESESEKMIETAGGKAWMVLAKDELRPALRGLWAESRRLDQAMKEIENNFGMTPAARRGLAIEAKARLHLPSNLKPKLG